jgi:electron transfer flavoprotein beta subunit
MSWYYLKINFNGDSEFDTNGVQYVINPNDELDWHVLFGPRKQGATVTVVNVGGPDTEPTLKSISYRS